MRDARLGKHGLEVGEPSVRTAQDRDLLERAPCPANPLHEVLSLGLGRCERPHARLRPCGSDRTKRLLRAAEFRHEPVGELEHLRRRAVVLLQPDHRRVREPLRHAEQVVGRRAGEAVDRLVVVADDAQVVTRPEPRVEQRLLQQVHVLVLVDRERVVALAELRCDVVVVERRDRALEQILEVHQPLVALEELVLLVDPVHDVVGHRRGVPVQRVEVPRGRDPPVSCPLDLGREVAGGAELERRRQPADQVVDEQRLRGEDLPDCVGAKVAQLRQRRRVEGARAHASHAEQLQT